MLTFIIVNEVFKSIFKCQVLVNVSLKRDFK